MGGTEQARRRRARRRAAGKCWRCGSDPVPDRAICATCRDKKRRQETGESGRFARRRQVYGLSRDGFYDLMWSQGGVCPICGFALSEEACVVDHCHSTGVVRGLLCSNCNVGIGMLKEDPERMVRAAEYVGGRHGRLAVAA